MHELIKKDGVNDDRRRMANLYKNFETAELLDCLRDDLNDGDGCPPLELRTNLLKLHELAMNLDEQVGHMWVGQGRGQEAGRCVSATEIHNGLRRSLMRA